MKTIKSISDSQHDILRNISLLHSPDGFDCDLTYGSGSFWKNIPAPKYCYDIEPKESESKGSCSTNIPHKNNSLNSIVFDPPFLTYVRSARTGNGNMVMANRFSGYWRYDELESHYKKTLKECGRVLTKGGVLVFKCQDIIHNHKMHCTHCNVIEWASAWFRLKDLFVLCAKHRMPSPNRRGKQKHARIFHSYFLVFERLKNE